MRKLRLLAALLAMMVMMVAAASGPAMAQQYPWDDSDSAGWYGPYDDYPYDSGWDSPWDPWWMGSESDPYYDWEYDPDYGWYPEEVGWEDDDYAYEVEYVPCGDDLCVDDVDRAELE